MCRKECILKEKEVGGIAQLAEHELCKLGVTGSNPVASTSLRDERREERRLPRRRPTSKRVGAKAGIPEGSARRLRLGMPVDGMPGV